MAAYITLDAVLGYALETTDAGASLLHVLEFCVQRSSFHDLLYFDSVASYSEILITCKQPYAVAKHRRKS